MQLHPRQETRNLGTQLLFYEQVTPISKERHSDFCVDGTEHRFEFAQRVNSVPLTAVEIPLAAREYTIVFAGTDEAVVPVVILGIEGNDNLYIREDCGWDASYIPAFVRRYPFVFSQSDDGNTFTLCVDEDWKGCNREGKGQRLFDDAGERTQYLENVLKFLEEYQKQFQLTQAYCAKLKELGLLESMKAELTLPGGEKRALTGFMAVNRAKLKDLSGEKLAALAKTDELELTYTHLQSMNNFPAMLKRAAEQRERARESQ
jgi:hypothetical protein